jgi:hypothetical protein
MSDEASPTATSFQSPNDLIKTKMVELVFQTIAHYSKCLSMEERYAFVVKAEACSILLERYTPDQLRDELRAWYAQLNESVKRIRASTATDESKNDRILDERFRYAQEVYKHSIRILMNSPVIEVEAEGELDINDPEALEIIRGGKRKDDGRVTLKRYKS